MLASSNAQIPAEEPANPPRPLPAWARDLIDLYESNAASQFIIYGNVHDRMVFPAGPRCEPRLGTLSDFLLNVLLARFDVALSYDLGNGIRVEKGGEKFSTWPAFKENQNLPKAPRPAVDTLTHYFRYCANLARVSQDALQVGCFIKTADLLAPRLEGGLDYDLNALSTLVRDWASDSLLTSHALATFLITENLNDLHSLIVNNPRVARIKISLPSSQELEEALALLAPQNPITLGGYPGGLSAAASLLTGSTLGAVESMLKTKEYRKQKLSTEALFDLKKQLVENDCNGLIEFVQTRRNLDDLYGLEKVKAWLRQDVALWQKGETEALPKGYLICGPVGTGKTFLVECLAGEAGVPVVKMKNFRDKWVGSTEGNLERIFRLLQALGRCYVFVDEADQTLGRRESGTGDSGLSGRIYSMMAEEMGSSSSRGKIVWVLASSRPDLIEVDLKRPGRVDVKIPLFPTATPLEGFQLIRTLCHKRGINIAEEDFALVEANIPELLTPGAAEALAMKVYRVVKTQEAPPVDALRGALANYRPPVPPEVMQKQIRLAVNESSDVGFVPACFTRFDDSRESGAASENTH
jgi:ATPase family associated with various cellular activities (AAA)